jgi:protein-S-isoprenylcysteine O-methyltransferase Ste14
VPDPNPEADRGWGALLGALLALLCLSPPLFAAALPVLLPALGGCAVILLLLLACWLAAGHPPEWWDRVD